MKSGPIGSEECRPGRDAKARLEIIPPRTPRACSRAGTGARSGTGGGGGAERAAVAILLPASARRGLGPPSGERGSYLTSGRRWHRVRHAPLGSTARSWLGSVITSGSDPSGLLSCLPLPTRRLCMIRAAILIDGGYFLKRLPVVRRDIDTADPDAGVAPRSRLARTRGRRPRTKTPYPPVHEETSTLSALAPHHTPGESHQTVRETGVSPREQYTMCATRTRGVKPHPSIPGRIRRALRLVGWNVLFLVAGLALIGVVGETYFRLRAPFLEIDASYVWSPTVGGNIHPQLGGALDEQA